MNKASFKLCRSTRANFYADLETWEVVANTIEKCSVHIGAEREIEMK